jgi:glycosyltransferase involved in cell wall biosynthesis
MTIPEGSMPENPFFTIILPTYNRATMLRAAIKSVLSQSCRDFECFVLDDGSSDETASVFKEFERESSLRLERFEDNRRQHVRRNYAISKAKGDFLSFIDSDDIWLPERLKAFKRAAQLRPEIDFWFSNAYLLRDGKIMNTVFDSNRPIPEGRVPGWYAVGESHLPYLTTNVAIRREAFSRVGLFREDLLILEDTELYSRMFKSGIQVGVIREPLSLRRLHSTQITMDHRVAYRESLVALLAGGLPAGELPREKERLALAAASYLLKSVKPREARQFLDEELGEEAKVKSLYFLTFMPKFLLVWAKELRKLYLKARYAPAFANAQIKEIYQFLNPLLSQERKRQS